MQTITFCTVGETAALTHARNALRSWGYTVYPELTDTATHILLPAPSLDANGHIHGGPALQALLQTMPQDATLIGGMLPKLALTYIDLLEDPYYLAENAAITAHCAVRIAMNQLDRTLDQLPVLIIGWGRIGKCLAQLLRNMGANVTVATRSREQQAMLQALGYTAISIPNIQAEEFALILNTAPAPVLDCGNSASNSLFIDLASQPGLIGGKVLWERGLPNRYSPASSGLLMAKTALRYALRKE